MTGLRAGLPPIPLLAELRADAVPSTTRRPSPITSNDRSALKQLLGEREQLIAALEELAHQHRSGIYLDGDVPYVIGEPSHDDSSAERRRHAAATVWRRCQQLRRALAARPDFFGYVHVLVPTFQSDLNQVIDLFTPSPPVRPKGRPPEMRRRHFNATTAALFIEARVEPTKYSDGVFAKALRILYRASGERKAVHPRDLIQAIDDARRATDTTEISNIPRRKSNRSNKSR